MPSQSGTIADAVAASLNAGVASSGFSQTFTAESVRVAMFDLKTIGSAIGVLVVPKSYTRTNGARNSTSREIPIDIGVAKRVTQACDPITADGAEEIDELIQLCEEIADHFELRTILESTGALWLRSEIPDPMYDQTKLREDRQFLSVVRVTFTIQ